MAPEGSGPVDSVRTDRSGRYAFSLALPDTTAQFVVGLEYAGVAYVTGTVQIVDGGFSLG